MESQSDDIGEASFPEVRHISDDLSEPEDDISSGAESFDEDDMYGSDNGDDIICGDTDFIRESWPSSERMVCAPPHSRSPDVSCFT